MLQPAELLKRTDGWFVFARPDWVGRPADFQEVQTRVVDTFERALLRHRIELARIGVYSVPSVLRSEHYSHIQIAGWVWRHGREPTGDERVRFVSLGNRWFHISMAYKYGGRWYPPQIMSAIRIEEFPPYDFNEAIELPTINGGKQMPPNEQIERVQLNTYLTLCHRSGDIPNVERQLKDSGVVWYTMIAIPSPNILGQHIGMQYAFLYHHTEELSIEVQTS